MHNLMQQIDFKDKFLIFRDFNARVGRDFELWKGGLGRHRTGNCSDNGRLLPEFCSEHQLVITNTLFQQMDRFKATWRRPHSKHWLLLDYALARQRDTREYYTPESCPVQTSTLIIGKVAFTFKSPPKRKIPRRNCKCTNFVIQG